MTLNLFYSRVRDRAKRKLAFTSLIQFLLMDTGLSRGRRKWDIHLYLERETEGFTNNIVSLDFLCKLRVESFRI